MTATTFSGPSATHVPSSINAMITKKNTDPTSTTLVPGPYDILCTRSRTAHMHIGNRRFKIIVEIKVAAYSKTTSKSEKTNVVASIIAEVKAAGGRFLQKDRKTGEWQISPIVVAQEKIGHSLRMAVRANMSTNKERSMYDILGAVGSKKKHIIKKGQTVKKQSAVKKQVTVKKKITRQAKQNSVVPQSTLSSMLIANLSSPSVDKKQAFPNDLIDDFLDDISDDGLNEDFSGLYDLLLPEEMDEELLEPLPLKIPSA